MTMSTSVDSGYLSPGTPIAASSLQPIFENVELSKFLSPTKITQTSQHMQIINTTPSLDKENYVDFYGESTEISPIKSINVLHDRNGKFERKGSFSSTPICEEALIKSKSLTKIDFFDLTNHRVCRKAQRVVLSKQNVFQSKLADHARSIHKNKPKEFIYDKNSEHATQKLRSHSTSLLNSNLKIEPPILLKPLKPISSVKSVRRNLNFNLSQYSSKIEADKIFFFEKPSSQSKHRITKSTSSATKTSASAKSPLLAKPESYTNIQLFDVLSHLGGTTTALEKIFSHLSSKEIRVTYNVCKKWRTIVENNANANSQRQQYVQWMIHNKENSWDEKQNFMITGTLNGNRKSPLKRSKSLNHLKNLPASYNVQSTMEDIYSLQKKSQRRTKCPRCLSPSIIAGQSTKDTDNINVNRQPLDKNFNYDIQSAQCNNNPIEFAECIKISCGFKFCLKCRCGYHKNQCLVNNYYDPIESSVKLLYPTGLRSKRNLRRLFLSDKTKFNSI